MALSPPRLARGTLELQSPLNAALIVSEHKQLLMPRSKTKELLDEVVSLAGFCDEESCKELIFITEELTTTGKKMKQDKSLRPRSIDGKGLRSTGAINKLEAFVDKLKASQLINDKRAGNQYRAMQKLKKKQGSIKLTTSTGPVPVPQMPVPPPHVQAAMWVVEEWKQSLCM